MKPTPVLTAQAALSSLRALHNGSSNIELPPKPVDEEDDLFILESEAARQVKSLIRDQCDLCGGTWQSIKSGRALNMKEITDQLDLLDRASEGLLSWLALNNRMSDWEDSLSKAREAFDAFWCAVDGKHVEKIYLMPPVPGVH
jgi:Mlc titration factor MtfA (ptsG expression regulator)